MNYGKNHYRKKSYNQKTAKDTARIEEMNESEQYYQTYGYVFENYDFSDVEWNWIKVEENWYYEEDFYYEWLEYHPDGSTD